MIVHEGDPLLSVNGRNMLDEDVEVVQSILSTLEASRHAIDLVLLSLPHRSLAQYKTRISQPIAAHALVDELGFSYTDTALYQFHSENKQSTAAAARKVAMRAELDMLWFDFLKSIGGTDNIKPAGVFKPSAELAQLVRRGLPAAFRPLLWRKLSMSESMCKDAEKIVFSAGFPEARQSVRRSSNWTGFERVVQSRYFPDIVLSDTWQARVSREAIKYIEMDLDRTFPTHPFFADVDDDLRTSHPETEQDTDSEQPDGHKMDRPSGQEALGRILKGYAAHNPSIGYCQSMNFIAAICLLVQRDEHDAFWLFVTMMERIFPRYYFTANMAGSFVDQHVLDHLLSQTLPRLHKHLVLDNQIALPLVTTQWFLCCFLHTFTPPQALRIWDIFLCEGSSIFFAIAIAVFKYFEKDIMRLSGGDLFSFVRDMGKRVPDIDEIIAIAFGENVSDFVTGSRSALQSIRQQSIQPRLDQLPKALMGVGLAHVGLVDVKAPSRTNSVRMRKSSLAKLQESSFAFFQLNLLQKNKEFREESLDTIDKTEAQDFRTAIAELHESSADYFARRTAQQSLYRKQSFTADRKLNGYLFQSDYVNGLREVGVLTVTKNFDDRQTHSDDDTENDSSQINEPQHHAMNEQPTSAGGTVLANSDENELSDVNLSSAMSCFNREDLQPLIMSSSALVD